MSGVIPWEEPLKLECIGCGDHVHPDNDDYFQESVDQEVGPFCEKCIKKICGGNE